MTSPAVPEPSAELLRLATGVRRAATDLGQTSDEQRQQALEAMAAALHHHGDRIVAANAADLAQAEADGLAHIGGLVGCLSNSTRGVRRHMATRRRHDDIEPYMVEATYRLASGNVENKELGMILPHEILHLIWSKAPNLFMQRFIGPHGEIGLREFWEHCAGEPWLQNHEYKQLVEAKGEKCIPIKLHGDDAPVSKRGCGYVFLNFAPLLVPFQETAHSRCLIAAFSTEMVENDELWQVLAWSLRSAALGVFPCLDHRGDPFPQDSARAKAAGRPIANDYRIILAQMASDWKYLKEVFHMDDRNYNRNEFCFICPGTKSGGVMCAYNYKADAPCLMDATTHEDFVRDRPGLAIVSLPGMHLSFIRLDAVHILFLGIYQWEIAAAFVELLNENVWQEEGDVRGGPWVERASLQLRRAYAAFKAWCKVRHIKHSETAFTLRKLSMSSPGQRPFYKCKAANGMKVMEWLSSVTPK